MLSALTPFDDDPTRWQASLELGFQRRQAQTVLTRRVHHGPLRVQKALYPEGPRVCHALLLHPPAGIVGGDQLQIGVDAGPGAHALLTSPGAAKWYRSAGAQAHQQVLLRAHQDAMIEWLPQESIVYDGALASQHLRVELGAGARFLGMEVLTLGRRAAGECFRQGRFGMRTAITQQGRALWREWGTLHGGSAFLDSPVGLRGAPVSATVLAAGIEDARELVRALREAILPGLWSVSQLPGVLVARWLGEAGEAARAWFLQVWQVLRPALCGMPAALPRIWNT